MEFIVYNYRGPKLGLSGEALSIRIGIILGQRVHSIGIAGNHIYLKQNLETLNTTFEQKLKTMMKFPDVIPGAEKLNSMLDTMRLQWKDRKNRKNLVGFKQNEHKLNVAYESFVIATTILRKVHGLIQLSAFGEDILVVTNASSEVGERYADKFNISNLLQLHAFKQKSLHGPFVFVLYDQLAELPEEVMQNMTHLITLPNLNYLSPEQMLAVRTDLRPHTERFAALLKPTEGEGHCGAHWDKAGLAHIGHELQDAMAANEEIQWMSNFNMEHSTSKVFAGEMETRSLWKHLRDNGMLPDDTWAVLEALPADAAYPISIPVLIVQLPNGLENDHLAEETEALPKRKTISLE
jgi:hypothetical protein